MQYYFFTCFGFLFFLSFFPLLLSPICPPPFRWLYHVIPADSHFTQLPTKTPDDAKIIPAVLFPAFLNDNQMIIRLFLKIPQAQY